MIEHYKPKRYEAQCPKCGTINKLHIGEYKLSIHHCFGCDTMIADFPGIKEKDDAELKLENDAIYEIVAKNIIETPCPHCLGMIYWPKGRHEYLYSCPSCNIPIVRTNSFSPEQGSINFRKIEMDYGDVVARLITPYYNTPDWGQKHIEADSDNDPDMPNLHKLPIEILHKKRDGVECCINACDRRIGLADGESRTFEELAQVIRKMLENDTAGKYDHDVLEQSWFDILDSDWYERNEKLTWERYKRIREDERIAICDEITKRINVCLELYRTWEGQITIKHPDWGAPRKVVC